MKRTDKITMGVTIAVAAAAFILMCSEISDLALQAPWTLFWAGILAICAGIAVKHASEQEGQKSE